MANEVKKETEEQFTAYVEKYQADGFTLKQAKEEAELVTLKAIGKSCLKSMWHF